MGKNKFSSWGTDDSGLATAEFVIISFALLVMIFFVVELTTLYFSIMSEQKSAHVGARTAIVSDPAATGVPATNARTGTGIFGTSCSDASSPCTGFATSSCIGGVTNCNAASFTRILSRMKQFLGGLEGANVKISYIYAGLGYAGGPAIPIVTVTVSDVPYNTGIIGRILGTAHGPFLSLPPVSVTAMGEDLNQNGG